MNPLEIVVTGDVSGATAALQSVSNKLGQTVIAAQQTGTALQNVGNTIISSNKNVALTFEELRAKMLVNKALMETATDPAKIIAYNRAIADLSAQMKNLSSQGIEPVSAGAKRLGSALSRATDPASIAAREVNNLSRRLLYMGGAAVFGLVTEGIAALVPYIVELFNGLDKSGEATKTAAANLANYNEVVADANKHAGEQIADLKILYETATNVNLSMKDRLAAAKALQTEFPDYFGNIKLEAILNGKSKESYDALTKSIIETSRAKAAKDKIDELEAKRLDAEFQKQKIIAATANEAARAKDRVLNSGTGGSSFTGGGAGGDEVTITRAEQLKVIEERKKGALALQDINIKSLQDQEDFLTKFASLPALAKVVEDQNKEKVKKEKKTDPFEIDLKALEDSYKNAQALDVGIKDYLLRDEQIFLEKKKALLEKYGKAEGENNLAIAKNAEAIHLAQLKFIASQRIENIAPTVDKAESIGKEATAKIDTKVKLFPTEDIVKAGIALDELTEKMQFVQGVVSKGLGPAFQQLFTNILDGSHNAFESFMKSLRQLLVQLAATVLKAAALAAIMSAIFPASAGGKGFGDIFKSLIGVPGHATGVSNSQGGVAIVGERGPELINLPKGSGVLTNGQLNAMNSGSQVFIPNLTLRGSDMIVAFNRANATASRNG